MMESHDGSKIWLSEVTMNSITELNNSRVYDGMPLFFYMVYDDQDGTLEFWVCKIDDAHTFSNQEFDLFRSWITSEFSNLHYPQYFDYGKPGSFLKGWP